MRQCLPPAELEALAASAVAAAPQSVGRHLAGCAKCRAAVEEIRENQRFIDRVGGMLAAADAALGRPSGGTALGNSLASGTVPGFDLISEISRGGQGVVYRALHRDTKRGAAVKMLLSGTFASGQQRRRFEREIEIAARLRHPCIVSVFDSGVTADGQRYVAMEYVAGERLDTFLRTRFPLESGKQRARIGEIVQLVKDVADAVGHAHSNGVIHRDLKPSNILVDREGRPRVLDFGLARLTDGLLNATITREFAGTLAYAAPEQFASGPGTVDTRSDVYSLGLILYNALTERHPYPCDGPIAEVSAHALATEPTPPSRYVHRIPADIETIVLKSLSKDPARRYASASALAADLDDFLAGRPISARRDSTLYVLKRLASKHRVPAVAAALLVFTILGTAVGLTMLARDLEQEHLATVAARTQNTIRRARLMAVDGEQRQSERTLWREAFAAGVDTDAPALGFDEPLALRQPVWALMEYYSRVPRVTRANLWHPGVFHVRLSANEKTLHARARDGASATWTLDGRTLEATPTWADGPPQATMDKAPASGEWQVAVSEGTIRTVDARSHGTLGGPVLVRTPVRALEVSGPGNYVAVADAEGVLRVFAGPELREHDELARRDADYQSVALSENERWLVATSRSTTVAPARLHVWSTTDSSIVVPPRTMRDPTRLLEGVHLTAPAIRNDGGWAVAAGGTSLFTWWTAGIPDPVAATVGDAENSAVRVFETSPTIIAGTTSGLVRFASFSDIDRGRARQVLSSVTCIDRSDELGMIAVGDSAGTVSVFDLEDRGWLKTMPVPGWRGAHALAMSADNHVAAWAPDEGGVLVADARAGVVTNKYPDFYRRVRSLDFTPGGESLVCGRQDGTLVLRNVNDGTLGDPLAKGIGGIGAVRVSPDGRWVVAGTDDGTVRLWDMHEPGQAPRVVVSESGPITRIAFSPDGALFAASAGAGSLGTPGSVVVRNTESAAEVWRFTARASVAVRVVVFSPDGAYLFAGTDEHSIRKWKTSTGESAGTIEGLPWDVLDLAYEPGGKLLFCGGRGPELLVLDPSTGTELASFRVHETSIHTVLVRSDGLGLLTSGDDNWIGMWDLDRLRRYIRGNARYWARELRVGAPGQDEPGP